MDLFDVTAVLVALAAVFSYLNYRLFRLPATTGILGLSLLSSLFMVAADHLFPDRHLRAFLEGFLSNIDLNQALLNGMLCFLLFAGALHVKFEDMRANRWTIVALATLGVILSTFLMGGFAFGLFRIFGLVVSLPLCLAFGALLSPTDPIAVMGLLTWMKTRYSVSSCPSPRGWPTMRPIVSIGCMTSSTCSESQAREKVPTTRSQVRLRACVSWMNHA